MAYSFCVALFLQSSSHPLCHSSSHHCLLQEGSMRLSLLFAFVALVLAPLFHASATPLAGGPAPQLRLHRATFDAKAPAGLASNATLAAAPGPYAIIQLRGPVAPADRA